MKTRAWNGDYFFLLSNLTQKDFKIRYRNMSLGIFWSLLNPLVTMAVLTFVWTKILRNPDPYFAVSVLCGIVPFNFISLTWGTGTNSLVDGSAFIKRLAVPREIVPIASVLGNCLHLVIQIGLLLLMTLLFGKSVNRHWVWLPVIWSLYVVFVTGLTLMTSAVNVFIRDTRYLVESFNAVLFWLVPIVYSFSLIPQQYANIYQFNPVAALVLALRRILLEDTPPELPLLIKLAFGSFATLLVGHLVFGKLKHRFYDYL